MPGLKGIIYTFAGNDKENIDVELLANMFELDTGAFHEMQQQATVHVEQLQLHFKNIQTRLKKIVDIPNNNNNAHEEQLKKFLKMTIYSFLQQSLPEYKNLCKLYHEFSSKDLIEKLHKIQERKKKEEEIKKQLKEDSQSITEIKKENITSMILGLLPKGKDQTIGNQNTPKPPIINFVKPALVPITGGVIVTLIGTNFQRGLQVIIGEKRIKTTDIHYLPDDEGNYKVEVVTPGNDAGPKSIIIINPDKQTAILEHVLHYSDDPLLIEAYKDMKTTNVETNENKIQFNQSRKNVVIYNDEPIKNPFDDEGTKQPKTNTINKKTEKLKSNENRKSYNPFDIDEEKIENQKLNDNKESRKLVESKKETNSPKKNLVDKEETKILVDSKKKDNNKNQKKKVKKEKILSVMKM